MIKAIENLEAAIEELYDLANKQETKSEADFYYLRAIELKTIVIELHGVKN